MRSIDAAQVAEELLQLFARVGVPDEILTDQGSNFTSHLLTEIYKMLHVHPIRTTPYHPQTDGLVERFNKTLKSMLRKAVTKEGKDWDKLIPYLLFAYREVPQASTGFSPFELLYGRAVKGPLDIIRDTWSAVGTTSKDESVITHVLTIRERLEKMRNIVKENLEEAQQVQKKAYDKRARDQTLKEGDKVLVLLPTTTNKLTAQWQGPYRVLRQVGKVTYELYMPSRRKKRNIYHINLLRKWHEEETVCVGIAEEEDEFEEEVTGWKMDSREGDCPKEGEQLSEEQREQLRALVKQFSDVFKKEPGRTDVVKHKIPTGDANPVRLPPYRVPHAYRQVLKQELEDMMKRRIIEPSVAEWSFPIVLVGKKDGTMRLCVDYRRLNELTTTDAYPMPRVDDIIDRVGEANFFSTLDLTKGYWQVPVEETDRPKTSFSTPSGLYQFTMMPFGLKGAPATFQRLMDRVIAGLDGFVSAYLDDVIIFRDTFEDHLNHLQQVLTRLAEAGLTAKPQKCHLGTDHCQYLGHVIGRGIIQPQQDKIESVKEFPIPKSKKDVRTFLGLVGYYRKFIPNFSTVAVALTDLTRKAAPTEVQWNSQCQKAFDTLKDSLCQSPLLHSPDFSKQFILQTDASERGVGAVLSQIDDDKQEHPVAFFSKKLLPREERYSTIEKECLAIKLGIHAFKVYLLGRSFQVQTDHRALVWLNSVKDKTSRLTRWSIALQPFDFTIVHRVGRANANADALSRIPSSST